MKYLSLLLCLSFFMPCAGCASKEQVYEHLYEGFQMRARMDQHPVDLAAQEQISYDRYKKEKDSALDTEPPLPLPAEPRAIN
ncbi:MAG: hypothetical protein ACYC2W_05195 [Desulfurivibrionaceae bacterium]